MLQNGTRRTGVVMITGGGGGGARVSMCGGMRNLRSNIALRSSRPQSTRIRLYMNGEKYIRVPSSFVPTTPSPIRLSHRTHRSPVARLSHSHPPTHPQPHRSPVARLSNHTRLYITYSFMCHHRANYERAVCSVLRCSPFIGVIACPTNHSARWRCGWTWV